MKGCFYKLIYIKMTTGVQKNQENNIQTKRNTKSDRKTTNDMKSRLTQRKAELNVLKTPRCSVGCQSSKIDVRNELCNIK